MPQPDRPKSLSSSAFATAQADEPTEIAPWKLDLLRTLAAAPSVLSGTNLNTAERYRRIVPVDLDAFLRCHVLGPAVVSTPVDADVECPDGTARRVRGYFKTCVAPPPPAGDVRFIAVCIDNKDTRFTPGEVTQAAKNLHFLEASIYIERSALLGCWVQWVVPAKVIDRATAEHVAGTIRIVVQSTGVAADQVRIPLIDPKSSPLPLPFAFFGGGYFGQARTVDSPDPWSLTPTTLDDDLGDLAPLVARWRSIRYGRPMRAAGVLRFAESEGVVPESLRDMPARLAAIELGRLLLATSEVERSGYVVHAKKSGNSNKFSVTEADSPE